MIILMPGDIWSNSFSSGLCWAIINYLNYQLIFQYPFLCNCLNAKCHVKKTVKMSITVF